MDRSDRSADQRPLPDDRDRLGQRILHDDLTWTLDSDGPHRWRPANVPADA